MNYSPAKAKVIAAALLVVLATGCGKQPTALIGSEETVTVAYAAIPQAGLVHIALAKGFFEAERLTVIPQRHAFGKLALGAVLEGKADLVTVAETPVMFAIMSGKKICVAAVIETSKRNSAIVARKDLGIASPRDLKGKAIGVAKGTNGEFFLDTFLLAQGMRREDVAITNMTPGEMLEGLQTEKIAAVAIWNPTLSLCQAALGERGVVFYLDELYTETFCLAADQDFVKKHPEAMQKVLKALLRAEDFAQQHPAEAQALVAESIHTDKAVIGAIWESFRFKVTLDQSLLVTLEDESRWAIENRLVETLSMPNYLEFIHIDALSSVRTDRVRIIR